MRKLLLLFAMCLATIGARAYNYPGNNASAVQDYGDGKTVCFYVDGSTGNQILNVGAGGLAEWFNAASDTEKGYLNSTHTKLVISGTMNADDFAVLTGSTWQAYTVVDMSGVTTEASPLVVAFPNVEYLLLPNGYTTSDLSGLDTNNPKLKAAGSKETLTGQTVPAWAYEETTSTVTKYYTDSEYNTEYTGEVTEDNGNYTGVVTVSTEKILTQVGDPLQQYTDTWADNKKYDVGNLVVTNNQVTPSQFVAKLNATTSITYDGNPLPETWMAIGNGIEERNGNYYLAQWVCNNYGGGNTYDPNHPLTVTTTYTVAQNGATYDVATNGEPFEENGTYYGTINNPGGVSFDVTTTYTYSYEDCNGETVTEGGFSSEQTTITIYCDETISLYPRDEEVTTVAENRTPQTLTNQTLNQLSLYCFQKDEGINFARNLLTITSVNNSVTGVDKLCMAGPSLGRGDLVNTTTTQGSGLWQNTRYFDFTGATFANATINITSKDAYNGEWGTTDIKNATQISRDVDTNEFYYFNAMAGNVYTCVLPTGNTEIPPQTFLNTSGNEGGYGGTLLEINIPNTYTKIGFEAFYLTKIKNLYIPGSITTIEEGAFKQASLLEGVEMQTSDGCTFGEESFMSCTSLKFFTMSEGVQNLPYRMFSTCANLESIRIPSTCKAIGDQAFQYCINLHSITLPEGVETLDHNVFELSGVADVYVLATTFDKVPLIYDCGPAGDKSGTFTKKDLIGNGTAPESKATAFQGTRTSQSDRNYFDMSREDARQLYQEDYSTGGYLGSGNCLIYLHYPDNMKWFYDGVPGFQNAGPNNDVNDLHTYAEIAPAGTTWQWAYWPENKYWNYQENDGTPYETFSAAYQYEDRESTYGEGSENYTWPSQSDQDIRMKTGGTTTSAAESVRTPYGWRQFSLMNSVADQGTEIFSREYDDTWYTMCFPWRMTDNQLFDTFNQKCEITEFKGAEVIETGEYEYSLVLHFDEVAGTYYMDSHDFKYERESDGTYDVTLPSGSTVQQKKYKYYQLTDGQRNGTVYQLNLGKNLTEAQKDENAIYYSIENIMVQAGHPYMIHPTSVGQPGQPSMCNITGVIRKAKTNPELTYMEQNGKVTRTATTGDAETAFTSPLGGGGTYTFIGYLGRDAYDAEGNANESYDMTTDYGSMEKGDYFLGVKSGEVYPKFYRKTAASNKWTIYTAIIRPDADALTNIEGLEGQNVTGEANVAFGDWEQVEATAIEEIIADAQERGEEVREVHLNVVYNINGQVVRTDGQIEGLPKGLYIVNGKKYMVK